jgi:hypothetical protein
MTPPLPTIIRQDNPRWPFVVGERWTFWLPREMPSWTIQANGCGWAECDGDKVEINGGYAFDGVTSPVLKSRMDSIPGLLASALLHDAALQAISEDVHWLEYRHATRLFRMGLEAFDVPRRDFYVAMVESWFNPFFNLFRK